MESASLAHCSDESPGSSLYPYVKTYLEKFGYEVMSPRSNLEESHLQAVGEESNRIPLTQHDVGIVTIIHYFKRLPNRVSVGKVLLISNQYGVRLRKEFELLNELQ